VALAIHRRWRVLPTGDFKSGPVTSGWTAVDLHAFAELGKQGVLALLQDSTNVDRRGYTPE